MSVRTSTHRPYDFLKWEIEQRYCRTAGTIKNVTGGTIESGAIKPGQPLNLNGTQWETADSGGESGVDGFFVDHRKHESLADDEITAKEYQILVRGPALVNISAVPGDNVDGTAYVEADLITRARALGIEVLRESPTTGEQTT